MVIEIYEDKTYRSIKAQYPVLFNPENYALTWDFSFHEEPTVKGGMTEALLASVNPSVFDMTFIIDGTGVGAAALGKSSIHVPTEIWNFMEAATVLNRNGTRKPQAPYCRLVWGNLCAKCYVKRVKLETKLLDRNGTVLRAALITTFQTIYPTR